MASPICVLGPSEDRAPCGLDETELRNLNLKYAERQPFSGDARRLVDTVTRVRKGVAAVKAPSRMDLVAALTQAGFAERQIVTSDNAVRAAGLAYAVELPDGCVFGSFSSGVFSVEAGGFVNDGGCLASYGH